MNPKVIAAFFMLVPLALASCAHSSHDAKYKTEKNQPRFSNFRSYEAPPETVRAAATKVLSDLISESDPATAGSVKTENENLSTGWVYGTAKNKYVEYKMNGLPKRKELKVRRKYSYAVRPSIAGSDVTVTAEEEIEDIDLKTGANKGWKSSNVDAAVYQTLLSDLTEMLRRL